MKRILFILTSLITLNSSATDCQQLITTAKNYVDTYIVPNGNNTITGTRANAAFNYIITALKCVDTIQDLSFTRNSSRDSFVIVYKGVRFAVKDSIGSGGSGTVTSIATDLTLTGGTITTTGTLKVDTSVISTLSALKDSIDNLRNVSVVTDTTLYTVINSLNTPPVSPNAGDVYLVGNSPTGAWVGHAKDIATWDGSAWTFIDGVQGNFLYNASTGITYIFRGGNWVQIGGIPALNNGNTISSGLTIGTNNLRSLEFETNNSKRGRFDSIGRLHVYNLPISTDTFINVTDINGKFGKVGKTSFAKSIGIPINTIDVTYTQLYDLYSNSQLVPLQYYKITDFQTIYDQPDFNSDGTPKTTVETKSGAQEHLLLMATSPNTFAENVFSEEYPNDKIKYDITFTSTEVMNAPAKGRISERIDDNFNRADYDFRAVLFKRYESSTGSGIYSEWKDNGEASQEFFTFNSGAYYNEIGSFFDYSAVINLPFRTPNIVFMDIALNNKFSDANYNQTWFDVTASNILGGAVSDITSLGSMAYTYIGGSSTGLKFLGVSTDNWIGERATNCIFGNDFNNNSIWDQLLNVTFGSGFVRNIQYGILSNSTFGNNFTDGVIYGLTDSIIAGDNCFKVTLKSSLDITMGDNVKGVDFGGTKHLSTDNDLSNIKNIVFSGGIDGSTWTNYITPTNNPEFYTPATKTVMLGTDGNVYSRYFNGTTDVSTIIN